MIKIEAYVPKELKPATEIETIIRLAVVQLHNRTYLAAVHEDGAPVDCGYLIEVKDGGRMVRPTGVSRNIGLPLDGRGRVLLEGE